MKDTVSDGGLRKEISGMVIEGETWSELRG